MRVELYEWANPQLHSTLNPRSCSRRQRIGNQSLRPMRWRWFLSCAVLSLKKMKNCRSKLAPFRHTSGRFHSDLSFAFHSPASLFGICRSLLPVPS
jgi:hypothetical protein